jgi:urea transporter/murein DD-endopeptidase MepM/ murein hydrolase activator NlpD
MKGTSGYIQKEGQKDTKNPLLSRLAILLEGIPQGYSQIFFSTKWYVGALFFSATCVIPAQGAAGLFALLLSNLWALLLGFSEDHIKRGYFAYNGLLTGLALALTYRVNIPFFILLSVATLFGVIVAASLRTLFERYLFIPVLSTPFVFTTWVIIAAGRQFHGLIDAHEPYGFSVFSELFPNYLDFFIRSLGAAFFQTSALSGVLVALGLLVYSRQAFVLAVSGLISGSILYTLLGGNPVDLSTGLIGFNFVLTAIAVGGVWTVPGLDSLLLAAAAGAVCAVIAAASGFVLKLLALPALAFPFVATTGCFIYALKHRVIASRLKTVIIPESTPEKNLKREKNARARFVTGEKPVLDLPLSGEWIITQGFDGEHTHKDMWTHAWDFEITDEGGKNYRRGGLTPECFYAFDMPVFAPADGKVVTVVNHIEDNPVGQFNAENTWGNAVVIWHYGNIYSALCHLRKGTVVVQEGEVLRYGQLIGKVGNSGRSSLPHLHFQVQSSHEIGSPTIPSELMHYLSRNDRGYMYHTHGCPEQGDRIGPLQTDSSVFDTVSFPIGRFWTFKARHLDREWEELWETEFDLSGNRYLVCRRQNARIRFFVNRKVLLLLDYDGPRNTGLHWFFMALPRLPMTTESVHWNDELPGDLMLSRPSKIWFDLVEPVFPAARISTSSELAKSGNSFSVKTVISSKSPLFKSRDKQFSVVSNFSLFRGLVWLTAEGNEKTAFELFLVDIGEGRDRESSASGKKRRT